MNYVNLTPHDVSLYAPDGRLLETIPPSGMVARLGSSDEEAGTRGGIPCLRSVLGAPQGVPSHVDSAFDCGHTTAEVDCHGSECDGPRTYIVSTMMLPYLAGRPDVVAPATGPSHGAVRDTGGRVIGVTRWLVPPERPEVEARLIALEGLLDDLGVRDARDGGGWATGGAAQAVNIIRNFQTQHGRLPTAEDIDVGRHCDLRGLGKAVIRDGRITVRYGFEVEEIERALQICAALL